MEPPTQQLVTCFFFSLSQANTIHFFYEFVHVSCPVLLHHDILSFSDQLTSCVIKFSFYQQCIRVLAFSTYLLTLSALRYNNHSNKHELISTSELISHFLFLNFVNFFERQKEMDKDISSVGSLTKCLQQPEISQAAATSLRHSTAACRDDPSLPCRM